MNKIRINFGLIKTSASAVEEHHPELKAETVAA